MSFYDLSFDEQIDELNEMYFALFEITTSIEKDNPFYEEILEEMHRIHEEKEKTIERKPKDTTNEDLLSEYKRSVL